MRSMYGSVQVLVVLFGLLNLTHGQLGSAVATTSATTCPTSSSLMYTSGTSTWILSHYTFLVSSSRADYLATLTLPPFTTTVFASNGSQCPTVSSAPQTVTITALQSSASSLVANGNFEGGNSSAWQTTADNSAVSGRVAQGPPLAAYSGNSY